MMPRHDASELATRLGREAEAVCRHYLPSGHRAGRYWLVGDVQNTPGRSMFVRLTGPESGSMHGCTVRLPEASAHIAVGKLGGAGRYNRVHE